MFLDDITLAARPPSHTLDRDGLWAIPHITLATGRLAAKALRFYPQPGPAAALHIACALARQAACPISLPITPPFAACATHALAITEAAGLTPQHLELSLHAQDLEQDTHGAHQALATLHAQGFPTALANAGSERSLTWLGRLPLTRIVLAPELLHDVPRLPPATARLHAILNLGRRMGLRVTATDVETEIQRAILAGFGCEAGEGALFGPPEPITLADTPLVS